MTGSAVPRKYSIPPSIFLAFVQVIKRVYIDLSSCCGPHSGRRANAIPVALLAPENDAGALGVPFPHGRYSGSTRPASYSSEPSRASDRKFAGRCPRPPAGANEKPPMVAPVHLLPVGTSGRPVDTFWRGICATGGRACHWAFGHIERESPTRGRLTDA